MLALLSSKLESVRALILGLLLLHKSAVVLDYRAVKLARRYSKLVAICAEMWVVNSHFLLKVDLKESPDSLSKGSVIPLISKQIVMALTQLWTCAKVIIIDLLCGQIQLPFECFVDLIFISIVVLRRQNNRSLNPPTKRVVCF